MNGDAIIKAARDSAVVRRLVDVAQRRVTQFVTARRRPVDDLGPMVMKANVELGPIVPASAGRGLVQILFAYPEYSYFSLPELHGRRGHLQTVDKPFEILAVDLESGQIARTAASHRRGSVGWRVFPTIWGPDGMLYIGTCGAPSHLIAWNPSTRRAVDHGCVAEGIEAVRSLCVGTDGAIYGGCANRPFVFRFDPGIGRIEPLGLVGWPRTYTPAFAYSLGACGDHVYVASGKIPWQIVACNRITKKQAVLLTRDPLDVPRIHQCTDGVYASIEIHGTRAGSPRQEYFRLEGGGAVSVDGIPDGPEVGSVATPEHVTYLDSDANRTPGVVHIWRDAGDRPRRADAIAVPVFSQPWRIALLVGLPDGRVLGSTLRYGDLFVFDPATGAHDVLGPAGASNTYAMLAARDRTYLAGYPHAPLFEYDPASRWTFERVTSSRPVPTNEQHASANPRRVIEFGRKFGVHYAYHLIQDRAGRILAGCRGQRHYAGGALVRYDPASGAIHGIGRELLSTFPAAGLTLTGSGRYIVYSSQLARAASDGAASVPTGARLFVFDADDLRLVREIEPLPSLDSTGLIAGVEGDRIVGITASRTGLLPTLYAVDAGTGELLYTRRLLGAVGGSFLRGPDGFVWTFVGDVLVRIDPQNGEPTSMGRIDGGRGQFVFVGRDIYLAGGNHLRRLRTD